MKRNVIGLSLGLAAAAALVVLSRSDAQQHGGSTKVTKAIAVLHPTQGNTVRGTVTFTKVRGGIKVVAHVQNLTPGKHGFHIHEWGDCSAPDASSAGGHFSPFGRPHAASDVMPRHVGDLGNITADAGGTAHIEMTRSLLSFEGPNSIIGRGVIVHADPDDLESQPSGNAGARVACGVVGIAKP